VLRKGWFVIPGVQDGDRTVEEQMIAVRPALAEAAGKSVLDLGCAEGLIGREFARAGAAEVFGLDSVGGHLQVATQQCIGLPMKFRQADFQVVAAGEPERQFDIVLALGVVHKMEHPADGVNFAAKSARLLVLFRAKGGTTDGIVRSKFGHDFCDAHQLMRQHGFWLEKIVDGTRGEAVEYWRRTVAA